MSEWLQDIETLELISQDEDTREILLRMASLAQQGRTGSFIDELGDDSELDDATKTALAELASDHTFLYAVVDYVRRTAHVH